MEKDKDSTNNDEKILAKIRMPDGAALELEIPGSITKNAGEGFSKAVKFAMAGMFPSRYERAADILLRIKLKETILNSLGEDATSEEDIRYLMGLFSQITSEHECKLERRGSIINQAIPHLNDFSETEITKHENVISDEFLYHFWNVADTIPENELRKTYSRILAKEVSSPGSISATTLHLLTTLHPEVARKFELFCSMTFSLKDIDFVIINMPSHIAPSTKRNSVGESNIKGEQLSAFGLFREDLLELRSIGLIRSMPGEEYPDLAELYSLSDVDFAGKKTMLNIGANASLTEGFSVINSNNIISLTRSGSELRKILSLEPHPQYTKTLESVLKEADITISHL